MSKSIRWEGKVRETKTTVQIVDLTAPDSEFDAERDLVTGKVINRWATICVDHSIIVTHPTSQLAWDHAAHPLGWCEVCNGSVNEHPFNDTPAPAKTVKVTIVVVNGDPQVHKAGCADLNKKLRAEVKYDMDATSAQEAANDFWADFLDEGSMDEAEALGNTRIYPCAGL